MVNPSLPSPSTHCWAPGDALGGVGLGEAVRHETLLGPPRPRAQPSLSLPAPAVHCTPRGPLAQTFPEATLQTWHSHPHSIGGETEAQPDQPLVQDHRAPQAGRTPPRLPAPKPWVSPPTSCRPLASLPTLERASDSAEEGLRTGRGSGGEMGVCPLATCFPPLTVGTASLSHRGHP